MTRSSADLILHSTFGVFLGVFRDLVLDTMGDKIVPCPEVMLSVQSLGVEKKWARYERGGFTFEMLRSLSK